MKNVDKKDLNNIEGKNESFFQRMKTDKKYSAKVQLIGYGIFIVVLVIYANIANMGSNSTITDNVINNVNNIKDAENTSEEFSSLLEQIDDNYRYDIEIEIDKKNSDTNLEEELDIKYSGKSYGNRLEITRGDKNGSTLYYKVDDRYYSKIDNKVDFIKEDTIYDVIDKEYVELEEILKLMDKASLDHVTDYSSGKKEYVYHLKVKDIIVSYQMDDVVEIKVEEENGVLKIDIDYSVLLKIIDDSILECKLEATITEIGAIEEFVVLEEGEENISEEQ